MRPISFVLFAIFIVSCNNEPEVSERFERYENGVISKHYTTVKGLKQGAMKDYYPGGQLMTLRNFVDDKEDGRSQIFYENGALKEVQYYTRGQKNGGDTIWYENGAIQFTVSFVNHKKTGALQKWAPDGSLLFEAHYQQDSLIRVRKEMIKL